MNKKILFFMLILLLLFVTPKASAKYVIDSDSIEIIRINSLYIEQPDKIFDEIEVSAPEVNDLQGVFTITAKDEISGIAKIELYINDKLYKTFNYEDEPKEKREIFEVNVKDIPFYESCYVKGTDFKGNTKESEKIIPNTSRINDLTDLLKFRKLQNSQMVSFENRDLYLLNDISLLSENWEPIGSENVPFSGRFHGKNHTISNLQITSTCDFQGLFGMNKGEISDLSINGKISSGNELKNIGGIAGASDNFIKNCKSNVEITGYSDRVGGIVGVCSGYVGYCMNYGDISGRESVGGICGFSSETYIECCGNKGTVNCSFQCGGGVVGYIELQRTDKNCAITQSYNSGQVSGSKAIGGVVGGAWNIFNKSITIELCYNTGNVTCSNEYHGGILGGTQNDLEFENTDESKNIVRYCYNIGTIKNIKNNLMIFQITHQCATVIDSYYPATNRNSIYFGTKITDNLMLSPITNTNSLIYKLDLVCKRSMDY